MVKSKLIFSFLFMLFCKIASAAEMPLSLFPIENYNQSQSTDRWLPASDPNYNQPLVTIDYQNKQLKRFYNHFYSTSTSNASSPWSKRFIKEILNQKAKVLSLEENLLKHYSNSDEVSYGENFRPIPSTWIKQIRDNLPLNRFNALSYDTNNRAIIVANTNARLLPSNTPQFYTFTQAGQGYPFDNLQFSSLWAGTPVYILAQSNDQAWDLVITSSFMAWVPSMDVARADQAFIKTWSETAKTSMAATIRTKSAIIDEHGQFQFFAYVGSVFPLLEKEKGRLKILIPGIGENGFAKSHIAVLTDDQMAEMPLPATRKNFSLIINTLLNRPYGWGGLYFYNDCSQELKSLFAPFGFWLPRQSSEQLNSGKIVDITKLNAAERIRYLTKNAHPLMTIVYIGGHIFLYVGNDSSSNTQREAVPMTYQNIWGLKPDNGDRRVVIGESIFFPLLERYPEDQTLVSLANKRYFQMAYLDEGPTDKKPYSQMILDSLLP